jgi:hypothetical protein
MFVVKVFASTAIALGNWSIDWGLDEQTMHTVVSPRAPREVNVTLPPVNPAPSMTPADKDGDSDKAETASAGVTPTAATTNTDGAPAAPVEGPQQPTGMLAWAKSVIAFWKSLVAVLVAGYQVGFMWVASVGIYLLLRRDIDGVQLNEVFVEQADGYGLPPLADDPETGVPEVARGTAAVPGDARG